MILLLISLLSLSADVQVYFSPNGGCEDAIVRAIENANDSIDVAIYYFTEGNIARALVRAKERGVNIRVLMDDEGINNAYSKATFLYNNGIRVRSDNRSALMHDKFAVIDDSVVLSGSYNWTAAAENSNSENLLIINSQHLATLYKYEFLKLWLSGIDFSPPSDSVGQKIITPSLPPVSTPQIIQNDYTVYITKTGSKYHRANCRYLKYSCYAIMKSEAISRGYEPCLVCRP